MRTTLRIAILRNFCYHYETMNRTSILIMILFTILIVLFFNISIAGSSATGTIGGNVSLPDSSDRSGIFVTIIGQNKSTITDSSGNFLIGNIATGALRVQAGKIGYKNAVVDTTLGDFEALNLNLQLGASVRDTEEVIQNSFFKTSISNEGNIGSVNKFIDSNEVGFSWFGTQMLREASLMIGTDINRVSDAARFIFGLAQSNLDHDFQPISDVIVRTSGADSIVTLTSFDDSRSNFPPGIPSQPLGVRVLQETYAFPDTQNSGALLIKLTITNTTSTILQNLLIGYFVDWDIQPTPVNNRGDIIITQNQIPGINGGDPFSTEIALQRDATSGTRFMGVVPLSQPMFKAGRIASVQQEIVPTTQNTGLTEENKYMYMRDRRNNNSATDLGNEEDLAMIVSLGGLSDTTFDASSYTLPAFSSITVGFAFVGGNDSVAFIANALQAQRKWIEIGNPMLVITDVAENPQEIPATYKLTQNYPNPFNPVTNFEFRISNFSAKGGSASGGEFVTFNIFNVLGEEVATLVHEVKPPGSYHVQWDASNVSGGVYFYRLQTSKFTVTKKMLLIK